MRESAVKEANATMGKSVAAITCGNRREQREATGFLREFARNRATAAAFGSALMPEREVGTGIGIGIGIGTGIEIEWLRDRRHEMSLERAGIGIKVVFAIGWLRGT